MADSEAKWYILHTYSGYENKVAADITKLVENRNLQNLIEEAIIPTVTRTVEKENGEVVEVEDKVYPGYVFVKMVETNESWYICRNTRGVTGFVGPEGKPTPLSEEEVRELEHGRRESTVSAFEIGDRVAIKQGVMEGFEGEITMIDPEKQIVEIAVENMFGEKTPTTADFSAVKKL